MTSNPDSPSIEDMCKHVKHLGYAVNDQIRLYGEEFEVISDPFPENNGIAIQVKAKSSSTIRILQLPATVIQSVKGGSPRAA